MISFKTTFILYPTNHELSPLWPQACHLYGESKWNIRSLFNNVSHRMLNSEGTLAEFRIRREVWCLLLLDKKCFVNRLEIRYPQCNYNSTTATASIRMTPPGPLHEKVAEQCLIEAIALRTTLPKEHLSRISVQPSTIFKGSNGPYSGSRKTPDLVILARDSNSNSNNTNNNNEMLLRVIFEIGMYRSHIIT